MTDLASDFIQDARDAMTPACPRIGHGGVHCNHWDKEIPCCYCGTEFTTEHDEGGEA